MKRLAGRPQGAFRVAKPQGAGNRDSRRAGRGRLSKSLPAMNMGIAEATVKVHRSRAMRKMNVRSLPALGRMVDKLEARA